MNDAEVWKKLGYTVLFLCVVTITLIIIANVIA